LQAPPGLGATGFEATNDEAKVLALWHGFPHTNEDMEMVGHEDGFPYFHIGIVFRYLGDFILEDFLREGGGLEVGIIRGAFLRASGSDNGTKDALTAFDGEGQHVDAGLAVVVPGGTALAVGFCGGGGAACGDEFFAGHRRCFLAFGRTRRNGNGGELWGKGRDFGVWDKEKGEKKGDCLARSRKVRTFAA
jgi:hypothetical protein